MTEGTNDLTYKDTFIRAVYASSSQPHTHDLYDLPLSDPCAIAHLLTWLHFVTFFLCCVIFLYRDLYYVMEFSQSQHLLLWRYLLLQLLPVYLSMSYGCVQEVEGLFWRVRRNKKLKKQTSINLHGYF